MEYKRLLQITTSIMNMPEYEEEIWEKVKELDMTAQEMQEVGLQR